jgi:hypothetical protein
LIAIGHGRIKEVGIIIIVVITLGHGLVKVNPIHPIHTRIGNEGGVRHT